jgi:hypothetical protein
LPDPNPIALWSVDRLTPLTLQPGRSGLHSLAANGNVVKARVIAMLTDDVAQIEILGQKVEVSTPQALKAGTTISVAINRNGQKLELVIQPDTNDSNPPPAQQPVSGSGRGQIAPNTSSGLQAGAVSIEDWGLTAQAAINEAILSSEANIQNTYPPQPQPNYNPAMYTAYPAAGFVSQAQLQAEVRARYEWDARPSNQESSEAQDLAPPFSANKAPQLTLQPALSLISSAFSGQPASNPALVIQAPFQLPQMQNPILMTIQQDDQNNAQPGQHSPATKRWAVNFSLDAGRLGPIQVSIGLSAAAVSVRLSSGQTESALLLNAWLPELKATLEQADFAVDEVSARKTASPDTVNSASILL